MTGDHTPFTHSLEAWLDSADDFLDADAVLERALEQVETKPQRRLASWPDWRFSLMNKTATFLAAAAVVVIAAIGFGALGGFGDDGIGGPAPSVEPSLADTAPTSKPSVATPTSSTDAFLPEGPFVVNEPPYEDAPSVTMTIPASGWTHLAESSALFKGDEVDGLPEAWLITDSYQPGTGIYVFGDPCQWESTRPETPATTVDEVIVALAAQASRDASEPEDVTVGGYAGKMITLHVPDDADFAECDGGDFQTYTIEGETRWQWHQGPGQIDEFWFIDVEGSIVGMRLTYLPDNAELLEELRALIESTTFDLP